MLRAALLLSALEAASAMESETKTLLFTAQWQTGLFQPGDDIGTANPHVYRPEEFTVNDLIYEGLTAWDDASPGADGIMGTSDDFVVPSLAKSWVSNLVAVQADSNVKYEITFKLREGVKFHDGEAWNADAAVVNFDHIMGGPQTARRGFHDWYGLPAAIDSWSATGPMEFTLKFKYFYEDALRELSFIRPFRFASPEVLPKISENKLSCNEWKPWVKPAGAVRFWGDLECVGITAPIGTGPYKITAKKLSKLSGSQRVLLAKDFASVCSNGGGTSKKWLNCVYDEGEKVTELHFAKFDDFTPSPTIKAPTYDIAIMKAYETQADVKKALLDGTLDMVYGANSLSPSSFITLAAGDGDNNLVPHLGTEDLNTRFFGFHSGGALNTTSLRKMMMCVMQRKLLWEGELAEEVPMETLFAPTLPYMPKATANLPTVDQMCASSTSTPADLAGTKLRFLYPLGSSSVEAIVFFMIGEMYTKGIQVTPMPMTKDDYNAELNKWAGPDGEAYTADDWPTWPTGLPITTPQWDIAYTETWGPGYDALTSLTDFTYVWPAEVWSEATNYLEGDTKARMNELIRSLGTIINPEERQAAYTTVITLLHDQAVFLPLTAKINTAVTNVRLSGFAFAPSEYGLASVLAGLFPTPPPSPPPPPPPTPPLVLPSSDLDGGAIAGIVIGCVAGALMVIFIGVLIMSEKQGKPIFMTLSDGNMKKAPPVPASSA